MFYFTAFLPAMAELQRSLSSTSYKGARDLAQFPRQNRTPPRADCRTLLAWCRSADYTFAYRFVQQDCSVSKKNWSQFEAAYATFQLVADQQTWKYM